MTNSDHLSPIRSRISRIRHLTMDAPGPAAPAGRTESAAPADAAAVPGAIGYLHVPRAALCAVLRGSGSPHKDWIWIWFWIGTLYGPVTVIPLRTKETL